MMSAKGLPIEFRTHLFTLITVCPMCKGSGTIPSPLPGLPTTCPNPECGGLGIYAQTFGSTGQLKAYAAKLP